ncbi:DUF2732 family protein [Enterobacter hormaechei]|uniref:DUF2732 family protein n=1 Tax=Enterobacter cloacae complex TaxID=354276 RepID=UPI000794476D|nr:DUF2732 family protein [Enterobacter hormaechei]MCC9319606.1 DUF2732 domain-containing protein [Enterobacter hormaechei subsp. xiangfangensis]MCC9324294.1 DUF2732 domain-containing protein [Enterobacter hormaechei subsp. xiangfangensis]MCC9414429.1 DUF2732 domain-containing protein [Enterobacter hormaechei subsp. xiangfangensis]MCC9422721.1 DUF2732 domain-containing protein [Enterobacter hormaechei subsp. xiangfangensis]MCU2480450.1 DUF2732 domain-containing protein [Enterobacter hormaechei
MQKEQSKMFIPDSDPLMAVIDIAKKEERKARAAAVSIRLEALAVHISNKQLTCHEVAELLRGEAARYENESMELH